MPAPEPACASPSAQRMAHPPAAAEAGFRVPRRSSARQCPERVATRSGRRHGLAGGDPAMPAGGAGLLAGAAAPGFGRPVLAFAI
ncbi:hypothetical protein D8B34_16775 [Verminephrobacter eiseniae]|nr:hypothetical protein [Verminephrobacter eiseniae]MCW5291577.1 hypothetical protein [Verminephrobacter eiseniae]MCW8186146.1 hypothetical protein [Verminephrobacter eiseniae]MCW8222908.1 hypothetical protein [Verminephrobacter eiseniae]MCW8235356.1 hypothetical protein [Verminephrobacter eiseniae]